MVHPIPNPIPHGFRNRGEGKREKGEVEGREESSSKPHLSPSRAEPHNVAPLPAPAREDLLAYRDLLDRSIADIEQIREAEAKIDRLRLAVDDARRRVANRRPEIERLRVSLGRKAA